MLDSHRPTYTRVGQCELNKVNFSAKRAGAASHPRFVSAGVKLLLNLTRDRPTYPTAEVEPMQIPVSFQLTTV